ncbi:hypothetical protein NMF85_10100 [Clostridioides difficile]|uniref:hypothetical protein n=1 Tax=Clostridioides difficile TaxID=1496 RepID=UPI001C1A9814|nr:hypothetical protein [Clostridioides difficile]MCP8365763.1 hypothetical protein [Clostridioides difficile]MCP8415658.1 hypothetical protein [Clostridioides difficile]MCP8664538.1 hypothetical protein [Clostridioides difficile]MDV9368811.1 hypothetical protein [Clostridioides difficile]HBF7930133.1 hypothetical protein [Clostridioides difficile]
MIKFLVGKTYETSSICDRDCKFKIKIISRTEKTLVYEDEDGNRARTKIHKLEDINTEFIRLGNYSLAITFKADNNLENCKLESYKINKHLISNRIFRLIKNEIDCISLKNL